jgi:hypothetical protein
MAFAGHYNQTAQPFNWKYTSADLARLLDQINGHQPVSHPQAARPDKLTISPTKPHDSINAEQQYSTKRLPFYYDLGCARRSAMPHRALRSDRFASPLVEFLETEKENF